MNSLQKKSSLQNRIPLLYSICFCFIIGIISQLFFSGNWTLFYILPLTITFTAILITKKWLTTALLIIPFYYLGLLNTFLHQPKHDLDKISLSKEESLSLIITKPTQTTTKDISKLTCTIEQAKENTQIINRGVILYIKKSAQKYSINDQLIGTFKINPIPPPANPEEFNIKQYYQFHNIYFQTFLDTDNHLTLYKNSDFSILALAHNIQTFLSDKLDKNIPKEDEQNILKALLLGKRNTLNNETIANFSASGAMHVLAVSGLHVGIFMLIISFPFKLLHKEYSTFHICLTLVAIWAFAFLTGLSPSVIRASTMFSFLLIAKLFNKSSTSYTPLFLSAFVMLLFNPFYITEVGFQLSYAAVFGILFITPKLESFIPYKPKNWLIKNILQISYVSIAAQLATAPISILYFHQFPSYFLLSNLLVIPIAFILVLGGFLLFLSLPISTTITTYIGTILTYITVFLNYITELVSKLPYSTLRELNITVFECYIIILVIFLFLKCFIQQSAKPLSYFLIALIILSFSFTKEETQLNSLKGITVYNIPKHSAISIYKAKANTFIADSTLLSKKDKMQFHIYNHWYRNNFKTKMLPISKNNFYTASINNTSICFTSNQKSTLPDSIDYLIIANNSLTPTEAEARFKFKNLIYDSSNNKDFINCIKHSPRLDYNTHIVPLEGAISLNF